MHGQSKVFRGLAAAFIATVIAVPALAQPTSGTSVTTAPGTVTDPVGPLIVPVMGVTALSPEIVYVMLLMVGRVAGGLPLLVGTTSVLLKVRDTSPLVQPLLRAGLVLVEVFGPTAPSIGMSSELKSLVRPTSTGSPLMLSKMFCSPLQVLSAADPQFNAVSLPMM